MLYAANNMLVQVMLSLVLSVPGMSGLLQNQSVAAVEQQYEKALGQRESLVDELQDLENEYRGIVGQIESLKQRGAMQSIGGRLELENLLRKSKTVSDRLSRLQERVRQLDTRLSAQRSRLVGSIDQEIGELEKSLVRAKASDRKRIVRRLNELRQQRSGYTASLPSVPGPEKVSATLELAEDVDGGHPDEILAAADEIQDTEDQLRRRLSAIGTRLSELRERRRLMRRAQSFSREERFFEETDRNRVIARYDRKQDKTVTSGGDSPTAGGAESDQGQEAPMNNGGANNGDVQNAAPPQDGAGGFYEDSDPQPTGATDQDGESRQGEPLSDSPSAPPAAEESAGPDVQAEDPFQPTSETVVIDSGSDPARTVGSPMLGETNVDTQIRSLEEERKALEKQAEALDKKAKELRRRADSLD